MAVRIKNLDKVISQLKAYRKRTEEKVEILMERLSTLGAYRARVEFSRAMYAGKNDTVVSVETTSKGFRISAEGEAVIFIEFGTGVINPEHPLSAEFGYAHGTYGQGKGANPNGWVYVGEQGNAGSPIRDGAYRTRGNPPARAMYNSAEEMRDELFRIAKEVFSHD